MKLEAARGGGCKYHPDNKQLQGVCPFCLRDKLLKLYDINNPTYPLPSPSQPFSYYMSHNHHHHHHRRHASSVVDSASSMVSFNYGLKKSNSIAFASGSRNTDREVNENRGGSKKMGVWSKLLKLTRKNGKEAFMHSRTVREGKSMHF
ncbi:uncharacterized protein LOC124829106 [Vigna umbellata]|uniref:Uncharacterized protein n=1 Tax=Phaseolus angularis TaxID=3914 RepID=A0A0L9TJE0_PHAAN|nr:uncharacterized protein LOC108343190 [Vigna angularis]XP_047158526.1 uncharacterized protein LOC124829106 [Vigna umbellata]KOM30738.1 hypothetical protein LR48_Vigan01g029300 [Vigna angularis]